MMGPGAEDDGHRALAVAQAARSASLALAQLHAPLGDVTVFLAELASGKPAVLPAESVVALQRHAQDALDCVESMLLRVAWLPAEPVTASKDEIAAAAAGYVSEAPLSPDGLLVALSWLDARIGFAALASALRHTDVVATWALSTRRLLTALRDVDEDRADESLAMSRLPVGVRCRDLGEHGALRLADVLERQSL
jgi:hypothetical protein